MWLCSRVGVVAKGRRSSGGAWGFYEIAVVVGLLIAWRLVIQGKTAIFSIHASSGTRGAHPWVVDGCQGMDGIGHGGGGLL